MEVRLMNDFVFAILFFLLLAGITGFILLCISTAEASIEQYKRSRRNYGYDKKYRYVRDD